MLMVASSPTELREEIFFTYRPAPDALAGEELHLSPSEERFRQSVAVPAQEDVQRVLDAIDSLPAERVTAEKLTAVFEQVATFWTVYDTRELGARQPRSRLQELRARAAAAETVMRRAWAVGRLARAVYQNPSPRFLERFLQSLQVHMEGEPLDSPLSAALIERAAEAARLEVLVDAGLSVECGNSSVPVGLSEAEKFLLECEKDRSPAQSVRSGKRYERFGLVDPAGMTLVEELANSARDWARSELHYAARFHTPVVTRVAEAETRCAELSVMESAVDRIMTTAWSLAERITKHALRGLLSPDANRLCARLTNIERWDVASAVSEEQVRQAESRRTRAEQIALLQKRLARMSSHPSILYARQEHERQKAAYDLASEMLATTPAVAKL